MIVSASLSPDERLAAFVPGVDDRVIASISSPSRRCPRRMAWRVMIPKKISTSAR
jgi:hypothetical protein